MILFILNLISQFVLANDVPPMAFPVFLKPGFSSILEFNEPPLKVVLGDSQTFQIEKIDNSIVVRPLGFQGSTNLFVYFRKDKTRMFVLTASEDAEPTFYKRFDPTASPVRSLSTSSTVKSPNLKMGGRILRRTFDKKGDYLTVGFEISADSKDSLKPDWPHLRLDFKGARISPSKLWSERREVLRDSKIKVRAIFVKPNIPRTFLGVRLVIPLKGKPDPITLQL